MTSIAPTAALYAPPVSTLAAPASTPISPVATDSGGNDDKTPPPPATATNADTAAPAVYTALASASASNIRGTSVDTSV